MSPGDQARLLDALRPGLNVYVAGTVAEPLALREVLASDPERAKGVHFVSCLVPGMSDFDYAGLHPEARLTTFMMPPVLKASFEAGRVRHLPLCYSQIAAHLAGPAALDVAIVQVTPPDAKGEVTFGTAPDFGPIVVPAAKRAIALVNSNLPRPPRTPTVPLSAFDLVVDAPAPIVLGADPPVAPEVDRIAELVAGLVPDGAAIQTGIGGAPGAVPRKLIGHRGLVLRGGMVSDAYRDLAESGALAPRDTHITGVAYGTAGLLAYCVETDLAAFSDAWTTHGAASLMGIERFCAINSALEVDLLGQANIEWQGTRLVSGVGGAPDFARAAMRSPGGMAVIALQSTAKGGSIPRIVPRLASPTASLSRTDTDVIVTEHGIARIRALDLDARAEALIEIAAPAQRGMLADAWREMRKGF
jgi:acyl-CoA hydrolase